MRKIIVLIDMDDTMTYFVRAWCQRLNQAHGTNLSDSDIRSWEVEEYFPTLTKEQVIAPILEDDFWQYVEPKEDAAKYIQMLMEEGFDVYICTASSFDTIKSKFDCILGRYFPFISWKQIIVTQNKQLVSGDIIIDDGIHNLEGGSYKKILMSAPHNESYDAESNGMIRSNTWEEAYKAVHLYARDILGEDEAK